MNVGCKEWLTLVVILIEGMKMGISVVEIVVLALGRHIE
jgi:hypothetical protein